ncbi:MAG TPA: hypothetical protein VE442_15370 [Jatrophihabitans sp.]|jgi:hypothetical protein|nr:hypothetical protein [Jatrophihabitans sp.]
MTNAPRPRPLPFPREERPAAPGAARSADRLPLPRWIGALAIGTVVGFLPWIIYLGFTLPARVRAEHYDIAWLGFDCAMWTLLAVLAWAVLRRHAATGPVAAMASTMLIVDAWFDIFTSSTQHGEMVLAIVLAFCGELPLAILCGWVAVHAERIRTRAYRSLHLRFERAVTRAGSANEAVAVSRKPRTAPRPR